MIQSDPFKGKVRVRSCGILIEEGRILLLKHNNVGPSGYLWSPPGGGVEFGDTLEETLVKEFMEETNLTVSIEKYLFTNEYIGNGYHAIELFFSVNRIAGDLKLGIDPELSFDNQILSEARYFSLEELQKQPADTIHNAFSATHNGNQIEELEGLLTFKH